MINKEFSYWLICPNFTEVRRFSSNNIKMHISSDFIFVDSGIVASAYGCKPPLRQTREKLKIHDARTLWLRLINEGWRYTSPKW